MFKCANHKILPFQRYQSQNFHFVHRFPKVEAYILIETMAATIDFHGPKHKHFLAPDFTTIALSDEEPISKALDIVLRAKKKSVLPAERDILVKNISSFAKGENVGALRALQEYEWKQLDVPLICRIYLRHLILQSCALTRQQLLECDFNSGLKFEWSNVQDKVTQILALGTTLHHISPHLLINRLVHCRFF